MRVSADRILYLSRVIFRRVKENRNLVQSADDETVRRAIVRDLTDSHKELEDLEAKVQASLDKRRGLSPKDAEYQFSRGLEEELRKHGV
ncbi:MAG TPA: hypothetical protein VKJ00_09665 [Thermoanaerobaculia bacterium]|nr:hypothetical protein [Thermoanaerobaculia bacterium]